MNRWTDPETPLARRFEELSERVAKLAIAMVVEEFGFLEDRERFFELAEGHVLNNVIPMIYRPISLRPMGREEMERWLAERDGP